MPKAKKVNWHYGPATNRSGREGRSRPSPVSVPGFPPGFPCARSPLPGRRTAEPDHSYIVVL